MDQVFEYLCQLPIEEKLRVVEDLWDEIGASGQQFVLPAWHRDEADKRAAELEANPSIAITREELWRRVDESNAQKD
jgi:putative addiction module component (TIGR02574 family)